MIPMTKHETQYHKHEPVLLTESVAQLVTDPGGIYLDATLGGGSHAKEILSHLNKSGKLIGLDQDDEAITAAHSNIGSDARFASIKGNFGYIERLISPELRGDVTGILFDLGVSTHQIAEAGRGFSFQENGPLDMRMSNLQGVTAHQVVNEYSYEKLRDVIYHFGEERMSRQIARAILEARPVETTSELKNIVESVLQGQYQIKSVARVFQGIRIEVNRELDMLRDGLSQSLKILDVGGRIVAISYHSLEDRIVKYFFKAGNHEGKIKKDFYGNPLSSIQPLSDGIITPSEDEVERNPAARSAKMRVAKKIDQEEV